MLVRVVALACSGLKEAPCRLQVLPHRGVPINGVVVKVPRAGVCVFMCLPRAGVAVFVLLARAWAVWCCPPRWGWLGQSLLPCDLLAGDWAGFCCPRPPRWGWLGCVSVPSVSSLEIGRVVAARCSPRWSLDRSLLQLFSSLEPGRFVEEVVPRWGGLGRSVSPLVLLDIYIYLFLFFFVPSFSLLELLQWAVVLCPHSPRWGWGRLVSSLSSSHLAGVA